MMASDSPLLETPPTYRKLELVFNCIFTAELALKVTVYELPHYITDGWNLVDVIVVSTAWAPYLFPGMGNYSAVRAVRVLRALRTVNRIPSLKRIIGTLIDSLSELANVSMLFCFFLFLFGIIGVTLFSGKLHYRCTEPGAFRFVRDEAICGIDADCEGAQTCVYYGINPSNGAVSYDNCLWAFVTIFQAVSLEGWVDQMYMLERVVEPSLTIAYYISVVVFGAMFIVNLFLAVIFESFLKKSDETEATAENVLSQPASNETSQELTTWEALVYILIVANTVTMCMEFDGMPPHLSETLDMTNIIFCLAFAVEVVAKVWTFGFKGYFQSGWNTFDFLVTQASLLDLILDMMGHDTDFLRALRVARVLRLLKLNTNMQRFEKTFNEIAGPMVNMSGVLLLIIVVFAMLGMELFGGKLGAEPPRTNFDWFGSAFITTFIVTSGENWNDVFADSLDVRAPLISVAFFVPLFIVGNYVLVNLFVAIICSGWDSAAPKSEELGPASEAEKNEANQHKLVLSLNKRILQSEHADLMLSLQDLIQGRKLGFSATTGARLMSQMMTNMKDFNANSDNLITPTSSPETLKELAGITHGFSSLVRGLGQMLDAAEIPEGATAEIALLCEYWDSEHAKAVGTIGPAAEPKTMLHLALKKYITTITANKSLMRALAETRNDQREKRNVLRPRPEHHPRVSSKSLTTVPPSEPDPLGADFLPLRIASPGGPCTRQLRSIVQSSQFSNFIMLCIIASSAALMFDMPSVLPGSPTANTLELLDYLFTAIFLVEMVLKMIAYGVFNPPDGYLLDGWNVLDAFIVTTSVLALAASGVEGLSVFRSMRAMRTLRPLRVIQRNPGLKQVVNSFLRAIPGMWSVVQVCALVFLVYGRFMMQFLSGRMAECSDSAIVQRDACVGTFFARDGTRLPRVWINADVGNFDNIFMAMLTLFEMSTLEMWPDILFRAMDTDPHETHMALRRNANPWIAIYLIGWIVISAFVLLNLFIGVVLENYYTIKRSDDGSSFMSEHQKEWSRTIQSILKSMPEKGIRAPNGKGRFARFRRTVFMLVQGDFSNPHDPKKALPVAFEKFIITLVLLNVMSMALTWYGQPDYMYQYADGADVFFTIAFTLEMILKLTGLGLRQYLQSSWNIFDATLVSGALIADALQGLETLGFTVDPALLRMLRVFRIARLLRLMKVSNGLNRLITTIFVSVPALANVGILLFLFMYIYCILGVELFHNLPLNGAFINEDANFASFGKGMMTLLRCVTGESYNGLMHDAMITEGTGRCSKAEGNCGNPGGAVVYFVSFFILESLVMLSLIIAVVLDAFADEEARETGKLTSDHMDAFTEAWKELDREATAFVQTKDLRKLLFMLKGPVGFEDYEDIHSRAPAPWEVAGRLQDLAVPDRAGKVAFHDVLEAIGKFHYVGEQYELPAGSEAEKSLRQRYSDVLKATGLHNTEVSQYSSAYIFNVIRMQSAFRRRKVSKVATKYGALVTSGKGGSFHEAARKKFAGMQRVASKTSSLSLSVATCGRSSAHQST